MREFATAIVGGFWLCLAASAWGLPGQTTPAKTRVVVVGALKFQDRNLASWSTANRRDLQLVQFFKDQGVPPDNIIYLADQQATRDNISKSLQVLLARSQAGDCLVFYYTGHGGHEDNGVGTFSTYDKGRYLNQDRILQAIEKGFRGNRAILLGDCCESGRLAEAALRVQSQRIDYAVMTSSSPNESGNGQWTFSQGILDGMRGSPRVDLNHDGMITWDELGEYMKDEMAAMDETRSVAQGGKSWSLVAKVVPDANPAPERLHVYFQGERYRAKGVARRGDQVRIRWMTLGYDTPEQDSWVHQAAVRPVTLSNRLKVGALVKIEQDGHWYPGRVLQVDRGLCRVHYDDYSSSEDTWIGESHVRPR